MTKESEPDFGLVRRRRVIAGDLSQIAGRPWADALYYLVLLAALVVDLASFEQVLKLIIDLGEDALWGLSAGFTILCIALAHTVGQQARRTVGTRPVVGARTIALACLTGWIVLGIFAFLVRWSTLDVGGSASVSTFVEDGVPADPDPASGDRHLSALLFVSLYFGTGLVSGAVGYLYHDPAVRQFRRAQSRRSKAAAKQAWIFSRLTVATDLAAAIERARDEHARSWAELRTECIATLSRFKHESRLSLLATEPPPPLEPGPITPEEPGEEPR